MFIRSGYSAQMRSVRSGTEHHHHAADVVLGGRDVPPGERLEPRRCAFALELGGTDAIEPDAVQLHGVVALGADRLPPALEHEPGIVDADRGGGTRVHD